VELGRLVRSIPALHNPAEARRLLAGLVKPQPGGSHQITADRDRVLLVLASKGEFAASLPDAREGLQRFALRMQGFARATHISTPAKGCLDDAGLVFGGDRRKGHYLPLFLLEHMAHEI